MAPASICCLSVTSDNLTVKREQEEVLEIFANIENETGLHLAFISVSPSGKWDWATTECDTSSPPSYYRQGTVTMPPANGRPKFPDRVINPPRKSADFSTSNQTYQESYVPPTTVGHILSMYGYSSIAAT